MSKWKPKSRVDVINPYANHYSLKWFLLMKYRKNKVVIYGVGQQSSHSMDWRGCNFFHGRLPLSPIFNSKEEAIEWLAFQVQHGVYKEYMTLSGHFASESDKKEKDREIVTIHFNDERLVKKVI